MWVKISFVLIALVWAAATVWLGAIELRQANERNALNDVCETMGGYPIKTLTGKRICAYIPEIAQD